MKVQKTVLALLICLAGFAVAETPLFEKPRTFKQHTLFLHQMMQAMRAGNIEQMEEVCRRAVKLMPDDATWTYNLACALAYRADKSEALEVLDKAIDLGFRNPEAIENDSDLKQLKNEPRFAELIAKVRKLQGKPVEGAVVVSPPTIMAGIPFEVNPSNTVWNMDIGCFQSLFKLMRPSMKSAVNPDDYKGPAAELIRPWLKEGSAAGNFGDLYMNRDRGHSKPGVKDFAELTPVVYCKEGVDASADRNLPNTLFDYPLVGNCSMAMTRGPYWRSLPRAAMSDQFSSILQCRLYLANQLWVYPGHKDYDPEKGDLFPANAPFFTVVQGSSFKDKPFVRAYLAAMAAMSPDTKRAVTAAKLMGPVMQMMMRYTSKKVKVPADYLTGAAHPVVFDGDDLNVTNLVKMAHELRPEDIVPAVSLQVIREDQVVFGVDYFDRLPEALINTPVCVARVARGKAFEKTMTVEAQAPIRGVQEYTWVLLQGDPDKVAITKLTENGSRVEIKVGWHGFYRPKEKDGTPCRLMSSRVDIGCFLKGKRYFSVPSIVSVYDIPSEERVYNKDKQIVSIDYNNTKKRYMDPLLSVVKPWKDLYEYTEDGRLKGWYRKLGDRAERFTFAGHRVLKTDKLNRPVLAEEIDYLPRATGGASALPVMTCVASGKKFSYTYRDEKELIGTFTPAK